MAQRNNFRYKKLTLDATNANTPSGKLQFRNLNTQNFIQPTDGGLPLTYGTFNDITDGNIIGSGVQFQLSGTSTLTYDFGPNNKKALGNIGFIGNITPGNNTVRYFLVQASTDGTNFFTVRSVGILWNEPGQTPISFLGVQQPFNSFYTGPPGSPISSNYGDQYTGEIVNQSPDEFTPYNGIFNLGEIYRTHGLHPSKYGEFRVPLYGYPGLQNLGQPPTGNDGKRYYQAFRFVFPLGGVNQNPDNAFRIKQIEAWELNSFERFEYNIEFDDALLDQAGWKNPRHEGCKLHARKINEFTPPSEKMLSSSFNINSDGTYSVAQPGELKTDKNGKLRWGGDVSYGLNPVIQNQPTVVFIGDVLADADSNTINAPLACIDGHSYILIQKILLINTKADIVQVIDKSDMNKEAMMRLIATSFPEGSKASVRLLDIAQENSLNPDGYHVKFNQGVLAKIYGYEPPRVRLQNGGYATHSFFGTTGNDGVCAEIGTGYQRKSASFGTYFSYGQTATGSVSRGSANLIDFSTLDPNAPNLTEEQFNNLPGLQQGLLIASSDGTLGTQYLDTNGALAVGDTQFNRTLIDGTFGHLSGSLSDLYSSSFHPTKSPNGTLVKQPEMSVGVKWSGSLEFTSISGSDGGSSTGIAGRREPRNPLRSFINNKVIPDIVSGSNQYFVTFESGNFGLPNNKMESISTAEITLAHDHGLEGIYGGELDIFRADSGITGPFGELFNTDQDGRFWVGHDVWTIVNYKQFIVGWNSAISELSRPNGASNQRYGFHSGNPNYNSDGQRDMEQPFYITRLGVKNARGFQSTLTGSIGNVPGAIKNTTNGEGFYTYGWDSGGPGTGDGFVSFKPGFNNCIGGEQGGDNVASITPTGFVADGLGDGDGNVISALGFKTKYDVSFAYPYSGYQLSFLRKTPSIILDLPADLDLPNGVGNKGFVVLPENLSKSIKENLDYFLQRAGLIESTTQYTFNSNPDG